MAWRQDLNAFSGRQTRGRVSGLILAAGSNTMVKRCCVTAVFLFVALWCETASAVLTGEYLFEDNVLDTSGFDRHGTAVNDPTFVAGLYPGSTSALLLNSTGPDMADQALEQAVTLPADTNFIRDAPGATLTAWVRLDGAEGNRTILGVNNGDTSASGGEGASRTTLQVVGDDDVVRVLGRKDDGGGSSSVSSSTSLTVGETYFLAGVFDYVNGAISVYIDGEEVGFTTVSDWDTNSADSANLFAEIGSVSTPSAGNQEYWPGVIDGARIFDEALTSEQIMGLFTDPDVIPDPIIPGDTNGNGMVDVNDLTPIRQNYLQTVTMRSEGDLTGDNFVNFTDFRQWKTAFLATGTSLADVDLSFVSVPEPSTICLAVAGILIFVGIRRHK